MMMMMMVVVVVMGDGMGEGIDETGNEGDAPLRGEAENSLASSFLRKSHTANRVPE